jgi:RNA polymerase sigma-70 factor (ECF subfamily)
MMPCSVPPVDDDLPDLIARSRAGDQIACATLYQRFVRPIYRLAYGVLLDEQDAEEVVQDSFVYAFQHLEAYDPARSAFRTWLYTITMSRCRNKRRRKWLPTINLADVAECLPGLEPLPERVAEQQSLREVVLTALRRLSPKLREAVVLRYFDGLSYREMAEVLDCPQKTVESRVRLAHEALYRLLEGQRESLSLEALGHDGACG